MYKISTEKLPELWHALAEGRELYLPIEKGGVAGFRLWTEGARVKLDGLNTVKSPKDAFFPQSENMARFQVEGKAISVEAQLPGEKTAVYFGVRACDARSFDILDAVFLSDPADAYYKARRENGIIVTLACTAPEETCFCTAFGIDPTAPAGDVRCALCGDSLFWEPLTDKGRALTEAAAPLLAQAESGDEAALSAQTEQTKASLGNLPFGRISLKGWDGEHLNEKFNSPKWAELSRACIGCGACTFVCPTCQCYDIRDFDTGHGVQRFRCWDSCMYSDFTRMAHGNPRKTQLERFRQRFMHKLVYFPANNGGMYSCVGCGRCLQKCPISMNIVKVIKALGGEGNE